MNKINWKKICFKLSLNLHNFEDEVHNIVDKAIKEMAMERMLKELEIVWSTMEFQQEVIIHNTVKAALCDH
jgi:hypothetical protein